MTDKLHVFEIISDAHRSLSEDIDGNRSSILRKRILFDVIPLVVSILVFCFTDLSIELESFVSELLTAISIFSGLLFSLIIVIVDKAKARKAEMLRDKNEESKNYLNRYLRFSEQLVSQISYTIILSFIIILILVCTFFRFEFISTEVQIYLYGAAVIILTCLIVKFFLMLLIIISGMYSVFISNIES